MSESRQWDEVVKKLLAQTKSDERVWQAIDLTREELVGEQYTTEAGDKTIAIYEYRYRAYQSEFDSYGWESDVAIEFIDGEHERLWRFPESDARWALLDAVRYQVAGGEDFLDEFLADEST